MDPILSYLNTEALLEDKSTAHKVTRQASHYVLYNEKLYKRSFTLPLLKYLSPSEADYVLREVHEGICDNHLSDRTLAYKILRQGYYWLTIYKDAIEHVRRCDAYQRHAPVQHQPATKLIAIMPPWPFA